jgi:hypothetical protein
MDLDSFVFGKWPAEGDHLHDLWVHVQLHRKLAVLVAQGN